MCFLWDFSDVRIYKSTNADGIFWCITTIEDAKSHSLTGPSPNMAQCRMSFPFGREREVLFSNKAQHGSGFANFYLKKRRAGEIHKNTS